MMFGKLQALSSVSCGQKRLSSGNSSNEAVVMEVTSDFFKPGDFVASLTIFLRILGGKMQLHPLPMRFSTVPYLLYNCSDSAQWYIQSFANYFVAITTFMKVYNHLPL